MLDDVTRSRQGLVTHPATIAHTMPGMNQETRDNYGDNCREDSGNPAVCPLPECDPCPVAEPSRRC